MTASKDCNHNLDSGKPTFRLTSEEHLINVNIMQQLKVKMQRLCAIVFILLANNADCLIMDPVSVTTPPPQHHNVVSSDTRNMNHDRRSSDFDYLSISTHRQWTGVLLLSLLEQPDETVPSSTQSLQNENNVGVSNGLSSSLITANGDTKSRLKAAEKGLERDKIERIVDANTIQLKKKGVVKLAGVRMPSVGSGTNSNFQFPTCFTYSPSYKVRQLLPKKTSVLVQTVGGGSSNGAIPQVVLVRSEDSLVVNEELVKTGFAVVKNGFSKQQSSLPSSSQAIIDADFLNSLQDNARSNGLGIFLQCTAEGEKTTETFVADFEPLEKSMETVYLSDGGKQMLRDETTREAYSKENPPKNPGDTKGCSDFETYEDALLWFETYQSYYGDVAKLDRDGDGVPCPGLPHTTNRERYRMKVPTASVGMK